MEVAPFSCCTWMCWKKLSKQIKKLISPKNPLKDAKNAKENFQISKLKFNIFYLL